MARKGKSQSKRIEGEIIAAVEGIVGKIQLRAFQVLTSATPVDTGFARASWTPSTGSPVTDRVELGGDLLETNGPVDAAKKGKSAKARAMRARNIAKAKEIAATYKVKLGPAFLSNGVRYLEFLNQGSSAQAGSKFIERGIEQTVRSFQGRRL